MPRKVKVLFFSDAPVGDVSTVHRCDMIATELEKRGFAARVCTGRVKIRLLVPNPLSYLQAIYILRGYDVLVLHRHGNLLSYIVLRIAKAMGKKVVLDFDDALFAFGDRSSVVNHKILNRVLYSFFARIVRGSDAVIAGGHYLYEYARKLNKNTYLIPTPVDTNMFHPLNGTHSQDEVVIGWMGQGNFHVNNLRLLVLPMTELSEDYKIKLKLVSALGNERIKDMFYCIPWLGVDYGLDHLVPLEEVPRLMADFDISVAPLLDDTFSRGKCAIKVLESMAMGIPVVASAAGENSHVIQDGVNGYLGATPQDLTVKLEMLVKDGELRKRIGTKGLETVRNGYTLAHCAERFAEVLDGLG